MQMKSYNNDTKWDILEIIALWAIIFLLIFGINSCHADDWNGGMCPDCSVNYELRATSNALKYYACPNCGKEVSRY